MIGIFSWFRGKDLAKDEAFQQLIADPESRKFVYGESATLLDKKLSTHQWTAMWIFVGAIAIVALLGAFERVRPLVAGKPLSMVLTIQMFMLMAGALIIIFTRTNPMSIAKNEVFRAGMIAVVAVFGVAWMADTVFEANLPGIKSALAGVVQTQPWTYAIALLIVSKLVNSQAAAISAMVPVALTIGVSPGYVVAFAAACYGYYILPTYPSDLATIQFDRSGTTRIGKFVINHSFILPGLIGVSTSCIVGYLLAAARSLV
jgi:anaerobic C4-dicarboxylate transporter DcuB